MSLAPWPLGLRLSPRPAWAKIGNICVSFHAASIHTESSEPRLFCPAVLMRTLGHVLRVHIIVGTTRAGIVKINSILKELEPVSGIEPEYSAWNADVLPLNYTGTFPPSPCQPGGINRERIPEPRSLMQHKGRFPLKSMHMGGNRVLAHSRTERGLGLMPRNQKTRNTPKNTPIKPC